MHKGFTAVIVSSWGALAAFLYAAACQAQSNSQPVYKYTGNAFSLKFHRPSCPFAKVMWKRNIVRFEYRKQAIDAGQKPCRYCLPPDWKSVGASILDGQKVSGPGAPEQTTDPGTGTVLQPCPLPALEPVPSNSSQADSNDEKAPVLSESEKSPSGTPKKDVK